MNGSPGYHCNNGLPPTLREDLQTLYQHFLVMERNIRQSGVFIDAFNDNIDLSNLFMQKLTLVAGYIRNQNSLFNALISLLMCPYPCNLCRLLFIHSKLEKIRPMLRIIFFNESLYGKILDKYKRHYENLPV